MLNHTAEFPVGNEFRLSDIQGTAVPGAFRDLGKSGKIPGVIGVVRPIKVQQIRLHECVVVLIVVSFRDEKWFLKAEFPYDFIHILQFPES